MPGAHEAMIATAQQIDDLPPGAVESVVTRVSVPVLVVWGDSDTLVSLASGRRLSQEIPGVRLDVVPNCGHVPHEECSEATTEAMRSRGTSKSAVSRRFVAQTAAQLAAWQTAPLDALDLVGLLIDGVHIGEHCLIVALGIAAVGTTKKSVAMIWWAWFVRNVRQVCDGEGGRRRMYLATVD